MLPKASGGTLPPPRKTSAQTPQALATGSMMRCSCSSISVAFIGVSCLLLVLILFPRRAGYRTMDGLYQLDSRLYRLRDSDTRSAICVARYDGFRQYSSSRESRHKHSLSNSGGNVKKN